MDRTSSTRRGVATSGWALQWGAIALGVVRAVSGDATWNAVPFLLLAMWAFGVYAVTVARRAGADGT